MLMQWEELNILVQVVGTQGTYVVVVMNITSKKGFHPMYMYA